jgi:hypothetical protein
MRLTVMKSARVCLAPLRFGAGIKGKLADAMLTGTPSVTTSIGAEAMHDNLPWCRDGLPMMRRRLPMQQCSCIRMKRLWLQSQQAGADILQQCFNKAEQGAALMRNWRWPTNRSASADCKIWSGRMLRHHQHKSTHYMARWIEEKNRNK